MAAIKTPRVRTAPGTASAKSRSHAVGSHASPSPPPGRLPGIVALKGIYFGPRIPQRIDIWKDCALPWVAPVAGVVSFVFGLRTRHELLAAARRYANARHLTMFVIDIDVRPLTLSHETPWDDIGRREMGLINADGLPRKVADELSDLWLTWLQAETGMSLAKLAETADWNAPADFLPRYPQFVPRLLKHWQLQAFAHPVSLSFADRPLVVATMRPRGIEVLSAEPAVVQAIPGLKVSY